MKVYILTIGTRGDVQPYIALGLGLKSVGHEVTIATLKEFDDLVTGYGLQFAPLRGDFLKVVQAAETGSTSKKRGNPLQLIRQYIEMAKETRPYATSPKRSYGWYVYTDLSVALSPLRVGLQYLMKQEFVVHRHLFATLHLLGKSIVFVIEQ